MLILQFSKCYLKFVFEIMLKTCTFPPFLCIDRLGLWRVPFASKPQTNCVPEPITYSLIRRWYVLGAVGIAPTCWYSIAILHHTTLIVSLVTTTFMKPFLGLIFNRKLEANCVFKAVTADLAISPCFPMLRLSALSNLHLMRIKAKH